MAKSLKALFQAEVEQQTYRESFTPAGEAFPLSEMEFYPDVISAKCVERDQMGADGEFHSRSICLVMPSGSCKYIPCTKDSVLSNGDVVDKETIMITPLERGGEIKFRADGVKIG